jgi:ribonuclease P protein component
VWRLGITVSTKVDKRAVIRNRMKRLIREAFRSLEPKLQGAFDIVIIARKDFSAMRSQEVAQELKKLLQGKSLLKA